MNFKIRIWVVSFFISLVYFLPFSTYAADLPFWKLVGKSHIIVQGTLEVPEEEINQVISSGEHKFVEIELDVKNILKGNYDSKELSFRYFTNALAYGGISSQELFKLNGKEVIVFLYNKKNYYLAANSPKTVQTVSDGLLNKINVEVVTQKQFVKNFDRFSQGSVLPYEKKVAELVDFMIHPELPPGNAQAVYDAVIDLDKEAIPAIIKLMDDRRRLTIPKISLEFVDSGQTQIVHYGPEVVTDVMTAILMKITGESLTQIYNGGSEKEREIAVNLWKILHWRQVNKM